MAGQGYITQAQAKSAQATAIVTSPNAGYSAYSPWFVDVVRIQATRAGIPVNEGGYRIYTSLDPVLQNAATAALLEETASVESQPGYAHPKYTRGSESQAGKATTDYLQGMVVALDPTSGDVRALVGGRDYSDSRFNRAVDGNRQPGSSFKPIVYAAAIADSIPPNALFADTALAITLPNKTIYRPENSDNKYLGTMFSGMRVPRARRIPAAHSAGVSASAGPSTTIASGATSRVAAAAVVPARVTTNSS